MRKNDICILKDEIYRILQIIDDNGLVINCNGNSMPIWMPLDTFWDVPTISDEDLYTKLNKELLEDDLIVPERKRIMYERFTMIAPILSFIDDSYTMFTENAIDLTELVGKKLEELSLQKLPAEEIKSQM